MNPEEYGACLKCSHFYECKEEGDQVEIVPGGAWKKLQPYCFYCMQTPKVRKIGHKANWTGRVPNWGPRRREKP